MPQSLANILVHVVFSTKERRPLIGDNVRTGLHAYMAGVLKSIASPALVINSMPDHVHILCQLSKNIPACQFVQEVKIGSSKWMKVQGVPMFGWQSGYGVFAVSQSNAAEVRKYIENQQAHHARQGFQDEFRKFLKRHGVEFDERYVWD